MSAFLLAYGPMLMVAVAGIVAHGIYQRKKSRGIDSYGQMAATLGLACEEVLPYQPTMTGRIGGCEVKIVRRLVRGGGGEHYETVMRVRGGDPRLRAQTHADIAAKLGLQKTADLLDYGFARLLETKGGRELWLSACTPEAREALVQLAARFELTLHDGELLITRDAPPVELVDCVKLMTTAAQALADAAKDPATTLLRNVESASDAAEAAQVIEIMVASSPNDLQTKSAIEKAARFVSAPPEGEIVARLRLHHPDRSVKWQGLQALGASGTPAAVKYIERLAKSELADLGVEASVAIAAIRERYPDIDGGQLSVSEQGTEGALSKVAEAAKQRA